MKSLPLWKMPIYFLRNIPINMNQLYKMVISDYFQRTRSYIFLITLAISLYAAYLFNPPLEANYTTVRIGHFFGLNNSTWTGYVTAMLTSLWLTIAGFFLINSNIKKDAVTGVGMIVAATSVSNFKYLLSKFCSNFMVLLTITGVIFLMSIGVFFARAAGYPFEIDKFVLPYLAVTLPAIFVVSSLAIFAEAFFYKFPIVINMGYFIFLMFCLTQQPNIAPSLDVLGIKSVTVAMQKVVIKQFHAENTKVGVGFIVGHKERLHPFTFEGTNWSPFYILSRLIWMGAAILLVYLSSLYFHRFDRSVNLKKRKIKAQLTANGDISSEVIKPELHIPKDIKLSELAKINTSYQISPFIKTELLMLFRKGPKWLWLVNFGAMVSLMFAPITIAHQIILPVLWFLQVGRWSDLATKEKTNRIHYFTYASYRPLSRLFTAQILAGIILSVTLAAPLMVRYLFNLNFVPLIGILLGAVIIVMLAVVTGLISGGKKLYEILFFALTYSNVNKIPPIDYFGAFQHGSYYISYLVCLIAGLTVLSFAWRRYELSHT